PGNLELVARVVDHLQEEAGVRATLVQLARGVLVARAVAVRDDETAVAAQPLHERAEVDVGVHECLHTDVIPLLGLREQLLDRALWPEVSLLACRENLVRLVLRRLDVGLVERIDLEVHAGDGDRELPAEELRPERVRIRQIGPGGLAVGSIRRLARRGNEALAVLAGRLGDELLGPEAEVARGTADADLVAAPAPAGSEPAPELVARIAFARAARLAHLLSLLEQALGVGAHQHRRHDPERRERRVATPDRGLAREDRAEPALAGEALELGSGGGDRGEHLATLAGLLPDVVGLGPGLGRA